MNYTINIPICSLFQKETQHPAICHHSWLASYCCDIFSFTPYTMPFVVFWGRPIDVFLKKWTQGNPPNLPCTASLIHSHHYFYHHQLQPQAPHITPLSVVWSVMGRVWTQTLGPRGLALPLSGWANSIDTQRPLCKEQARQGDLEEYLFWKIFIGVELVYNVGLVSGV